MRTLLITGTDTNVGKTWVSCLLLRNLRGQGHSVGAYKPVCSGALNAESGESSWHDVDALTDAAGWDGDKQRICPQTFQAAVAPNIAAEMEGRSVDDTLLHSGADAWQDHADFLIVEGAGGLLCPLSNRTSVADLAEQLTSPLVIVAANRLGMINHTLLTAAVAQHRGLHVAAVVVNDLTSSSDDQSRESNVHQLRNWLPGIEVLSCEFGANVLLGIKQQPISADMLFRPRSRHTKET